MAQKRIWAKAQSEAISDRGHDLLVSAGAGSGKTAVLTERIIRRLTDRENPLDITRMLIVTFTKAAASELKEDRLHLAEAAGVVFLCLHRDLHQSGGERA